MLIYSATNKLNNYKYIGQTIFSLEERKKKHLLLAAAGSDYYFHRAIRKYGEENFEWEVLKFCQSPEELNEQEIYYIAYYDSFNPEKGYNLTKGGRGALGWTHSEETKEKLRKAALERGFGKTVSEKQRKAISLAQTGKNYIQRFGEEKAQQIIAEKSRPYEEKFGVEKAQEIKKKQSNSNKSHLPQIKEKMSATHKKNLAERGGTYLTDKSKQKLRESKLGENNPMFVKMLDEDITKLIERYNQCGSLSKKVVSEFPQYTKYILFKTLKNLNLWKPDLRNKLSS